jgi:hypothetical protein
MVTALLVDSLALRFIMEQLYAWTTYNSKAITMRSRQKFSFVIIVIGEPRGGLVARGKNSGTIIFSRVYSLSIVRPTTGSSTTQRGFSDDRWPRTFSRARFILSAFIPSGEAHGSKVKALVFVFGSVFFSPSLD